MYEISVLLSTLGICLGIYFWPYDHLEHKAKNSVLALNELADAFDRGEHDGRINPEIAEKMTRLRVHVGLMDRWIKEKK